MSNRFPEVDPQATQLPLKFFRGAAVLLCTTIILQGDPANGDTVEHVALLKGKAPEDYIPNLFVDPRLLSADELERLPPSLRHTNLLGSQKVGLLDVTATRHSDERAKRAAELRARYEGVMYKQSPGRMPPMSVSNRSNPSEGSPLPDIGITVAQETLRHAVNYRSRAEQISRNTPIAQTHPRYAPVPTGAVARGGSSRFLKTLRYVLFGTAAAAGVAGAVVHQTKKRE